MKTKFKENITLHLEIARAIGIFLEITKADEDYIDELQARSSFSILFEMNEAFCLQNATYEYRLQEILCLIAVASFETLDAFFKLLLLIQC